MNRPEPLETIRAHVFVSGRVQGVGYRFQTGYEAHRLGVKGWVRNLSDGRVEAVFEGTPNAVESLIDWCRRGPETALVQGIEVEYESPENLETFETRRSHSGKN